MFSRRALALLVLLVATVSGFGPAAARPLSSTAIRQMVREDRRSTVRRFKEATARYLAGKQLRGYVAVPEGDVIRLHRKGQENDPWSPAAIIHDGKLAHVEVFHSRQEKNGLSSLWVHYAPGQTLSASTLGPRSERALIFSEGGARNNGDHPGGRFLTRRYAWGGSKKGIVAITSQVMEHDGDQSFPVRPTGSGPKELGPSYNSREGVYVSYPKGTPAGADTAPGQYLLDPDRQTWSTPESLKQVRSYPLNPKHR